jgi:hypothetical protein
MRNISRFVDFVMETITPESAFRVVEVRHKNSLDLTYWMIASVHNYSENTEALDSYYQNIADNNQGAHIDNCLAEWFENLDDDEKQDYNIPDGVGFEEAIDHIHPDVYNEVWRSCADDSQNVYTNVSIARVSSVSSLFKLFIDSAKKSQPQNDTNIVNLVKEHIEQADMSNEIRRELNIEMSNFRRNMKTKSLFGM